MPPTITDVLETPGHGQVRMHRARDGSGMAELHYDTVVAGARARRVVYVPTEILVAVARVVAVDEVARELNRAVERLRAGEAA